MKRNLHINENLKLPEKVSKNIFLILLKEEYTDRTNQNPNTNI